MRSARKGRCGWGCGWGCGRVPRGLRRVGAAAPRGRTPGVWALVVGGVRTGARNGRKGPEPATADPSEGAVKGGWEPQSARVCAAPV